MSKKSNLSERLAEIRKSKGFTQEALEDASGISRRAIQDIERGLNSPSVLTLEALAGALEIGVAEFFGKQPFGVASIADQDNRFEEIQRHNARLMEMIKGLSDQLKSLKGDDLANVPPATREALANYNGSWAKVDLILRGLPTAQSERKAKS